MIIGSIEVSGCYRLNCNNLKENRVNVVVDLDETLLLGKRPDGDNLFCGQSSQPTIVDLQSRQIGTKYLQIEDITVADIQINCPEINCIWNKVTSIHQS